jgi:hypothetical protein
VLPVMLLWRISTSTGKSTAARHGARWPKDRWVSADVFTKGWNCSFWTGMATRIGTLPFCLRVRVTLDTFQPSNYSMRVRPPGRWDRIAHVFQSAGRTPSTTHLII